MWVGASWCESLELVWGVGVALAGGRRIRPCPTTTPSTFPWLWSTKATLNGPTTPPSTRPYTPLTTPRSKEERTSIAPPRVPTHTPNEVAATSFSLASRRLKPHTRSLECLHDGRGWGQHSGLFSCSDPSDMNRDNRTKQHCPKKARQLGIRPSVQITGVEGEADLSSGGGSDSLTLMMVLRAALRGCPFALATRA